MILTIFLSLLVPLSVFIGLNIFNNVAITFLMFHFGICVLIPWIDLAIIKRLSIKEIMGLIGFRNFRKNIGWGALLGVVFLLSIYSFFVILANRLIDAASIRNLLMKWNVQDQYLFSLLFIMIFANSVLEEIYWRGYIFARLKANTGFFGTILLTSLFYASYHLITTGNLFSLQYGILLTTAVFLAGVFWGIVRYKSDSIWIPIISHMLADLGIMMVYLRFIR
jgi:membrane protease YdiL (CAAX protease family)